MIWKNNVPGTTQVSFYEMCLRVTVKLKGSYLVSKTENSLAQAAEDDIIIQTSSTQSVILVREWMGRAPFLLPAEITSITSASRVRVQICCTVVKINLTSLHTTTFFDSDG